MGWLTTFLTTLKHMIVPPGQTPLDPLIMMIVFLCNLGSAMVVTMPFSFLPKMMREFGIQEKDIGNYVGLTASSLYVGRSFASYFWGWLCDRFGRKKSLMISMTLMNAFTLLFGFSRSFAWAFTARLLQGFAGGMIIALKATVFAICDETNNSLGMAMVLSSFQIGLIVGPAIGGFLACPADNFPSSFPKDSVFGQFPFLLPILINCILLVFGMILTAIKIPETLERDAKDEKTTLLNGGPHKADSSNSTKARTSSCSKSYLDMYAYEVFLARESYTVLGMKPKKGQVVKDKDFGKATVSYFQVELDSNILQRSSSQTQRSCCRGIRESSFWYLMRIRNVQLSLALYAIFSFITVGFDETFPIFADSSKIFGGLSFTSDEIGTAILAAAIPMVVLVFLVARVERKIGAKMLLILQLYVMIVGLPLFAYIGYVPKRYVWYALIPFLVVERFAMSCGFMAVNIILNNAADPQYMGMVNGLGMTASCVFRSISPTILGSIYSWSLKNERNVSYPFNHHFPFVLCAFMGLFTLLVAVFLPDKFPAKDLVLDTSTCSDSAEDSDSENATKV